MQWHESEQDTQQFLENGATTVIRRELHLLSVAFLLAETLPLIPPLFEYLLHTACFHCNNGVFFAQCRVFAIQQHRIGRYKRKPMFETQKHKYKNTGITVTFPTVCACCSCFSFSMPSSDSTSALWFSSKRNNGSLFRTVIKSLFVDFLVTVTVRLSVSRKANMGDLDKAR